MPFQLVVTTSVHFNAAWANVPGWAMISLTAYITANGPFGASVLQHDVNGLGVHRYYFHAFVGPGAAVVRLHPNALATPSGRMPIFAPPAMAAPAPPMHAPTGGG